MGKYEIRDSDMEYLAKNLPGYIYNSVDWISIRDIIRLAFAFFSAISLIALLISEPHFSANFAMFFFSSIAVLLLLKPFSQLLARIIARKTLESKSFEAEDWQIKVNVKYLKYVINITKTALDEYAAKRS